MISMTISLQAVVDQEGGQHLEEQAMARHLLEVLLAVMA